MKPEDGVFTICPNRTGCPGQQFQHVKHFRGALEIEGLGEKNAYRFLQEGLISDAADIFDLTAERIAELEGFGEISARNLVEEIEEAKKMPFSRVLYALGIPGIGFVNAESLAEHFGTMDALLEAQPEDIEKAEGIGPVLAQQIYEELSEKRTRQLIERLRKAGLRMELDPSERRQQGGPLDGKSLVFTGTLPNLSREQATRADPARGGKGGQLGLEEDRLRDRGRQPRLEAGEGRGARHGGDRRGGLQKLVGDDGAPRKRSTPPRGRSATSRPAGRGSWEARTAQLAAAASASSRSVKSLINTIWASRTVTTVKMRWCTGTPLSFPRIAFCEMHRTCSPPRSETSSTEIRQSSAASSQPETRVSHASFPRTASLMKGGFHSASGEIAAKASSTSGDSLRGTGLAQYWANS